MSFSISADGLAKIKETIRKQQQCKSSSQPREHKEELNNAYGTGEVDSLSHRTLHDANEPLQTRSQDLIEGSEKTAKVRKIAAGPAAPTYKGFSEAEVKYRIVESKGGKTNDAGKKDKKRQTSHKIQDKRIEPVGTWLDVEEGDGKVKKVTRVIAPSKKQAKQQSQPKSKEIITTSSWRAGQELILRELGPVKKKTGRGRENTDYNRDHVTDPDDRRPETQGEEDIQARVGSATAAEIQHHKALSEEARKVYNDLHIEDRESQRRYVDHEKRWKPPVKRKAPKMSENEKQQQSSAKQRHYDQEQVRKYMQRRKSERLKKQREEESRMKEEEDARRKHLEELYSKQKHASQVSAAIGKKEKNRRQPLESNPLLSSTELAKQNAYNMHKARYLNKPNEEDKENQLDDGEMDISDSSSTITGDDDDDVSPNGSPRRSTIDVDSGGQTLYNNKEGHKLNNNTNTVVRVDNNTGDPRTFSFDISGVTSKFTQALQAKLNEEPPSLAGAYGSRNNQDYLNNDNDGSSRSRADRIQAIKDTAATLQNRLKEEARKIQAQSSANNQNENGASARPTVRWRDTDNTEKEEFMSKYERVTASKDDYTVFKSNLPGTQTTVRTHETESERKVGSSGTVYPKSTTKYASGTNVHNDIGEDTTITETSTFSEITLTDDSDDDLLTDRKIGTGLRESELHARSMGSNKPTPMNIPRPSHPVTNKASNSWDDPQPDDYNVFSIYSRRQDRLIRPGREPMSKKKSEPEFQAQQEIMPSITKPTSSHPKSSILSARSKSPALYNQPTESLRTESPVERKKSKQSKSSIKSVEHYDDEDEDTLGEESYTQSFESESRMTSHAKSASEKPIHSQKSLPASVKTVTKTPERMSPEMESTLDEEITEDEELTPVADRKVSDSEPAASLRLSPNSLERKFYNEFHNLESMELSLKQLTSVERTRAVSMAQQETVSLAQMLKAKQQGYDQQMKEIQIKAQLEATEATKQLEDARKRASEAAINAADMIAKVRGEGVSAIQDSTRKLIDTQTKAAKATAEAAKFLSEARALGLQDTNTLAIETASAAATSAVKTALEKKWLGDKPKTKSGKRHSDEAHDQDDSESIGSMDDFSINESMTEDEREEKSFRLILPSESHRKKGKHVHSDNESVASEASSTRMLDHDIHALFKEGSFDKFTEDMVQQFMKEEALQAQHQIDEASDVEKQRKDYKSDSEIYTEPRSARRPKHDPEKYKKIHLDEKYLTERQSKLMDRRKNAEELLKWKAVLDKEEQRVFKLEKKALKTWEHKETKKDSEVSQVVTKETEKPSSRKDNGTTKDSTIKTVSIAQDSTAVSENISTARDESLYTSIKEDIKTASTAESVSSNVHHRRMMNDKSNIKNNHSGSESSVIEDIQSQSSVDDSKKLNDSSDDTMTQSYGNETFEDTTQTTSKKTSKSQNVSKSPLDKLKKYRGLSSPGRSPRGLFSSRSHSRNSESESEDSFSHNESQSELSDFEGKIRALNEQLRKRKTEADKLKRERKKKKRELMKNKEETLKKQIEAYDNQIAELRVELQKEMAHEPAKTTTVRPQIKQPKVSATKTTIKTPTKQRPETDSSGPESSLVSPATPEDKDLKQISPKTPTGVSKTAKAALDKISEGSETPTSRSESTYREKIQSIKELKSTEASVEDGTDEIEEEISASSIASDEKFKGLHIDLKTSQDLYEVEFSNKEPVEDEKSYTEDFDTEAITTTFHDRPLSARSEEADVKTVPHSARSVTEQISEQISENLPSYSASESFVKQLDLKTPTKDASVVSDVIEKEPDSEGEYSQRSSRPSSGRSEGSYQAENESSESEKSPALLSMDKTPKLKDDISEKSTSNKQSGLISYKLSDIDDLIDFGKEEMTPVASPCATPNETPRMESNSERSEKSNFFDPLGDFDIGDRVSVTGPSGERLTGTLLFKGNVQFAPGVWAGVELDEPEGRHNGMEDGVRYFTCRNKHGLIVPGHDMLAATETEEQENGFDNVDVRTSIDSVKSASSVNTDDGGDLLKFIKEADENVQMFDEDFEPSPREEVENKKVSVTKSRNDLLADKITNDLFESVVKENVGAISKIADRKQANKKKGPPVAPKPSKSQQEQNPQTNGDIDDIENFFNQEAPLVEVLEPDETDSVDSKTDVTVNNMMNDAIEHMLDIRRKARHQIQEINQSRDSGIEPEEEHVDVPSSPTDELQGVLDKPDDNTPLDTPLDTPPRPGSPVPGLQSDKESHKPVVGDSGLFDGEYDDELWVPPNKAPPPYPENEVPRSELKKFAEEVFYAVPHEEKEIGSIVSSAVDEFWEQRRYGEPLTDLQPTEAFYTHEEIGSDLISNSRRVFKKLLFDLTGEVIRNIYKEEEYDSPVAWHKPKRKTNKFYRGATPPRTIDVLKPVVQNAVIDILGLNGAKKSEKTKWGIRKKKDLVDTILVQELREEEPDWVNYDDDELAVKMQLTETIFNDLLTDTVQTMNKIFRRKHSMQQQNEAAK
ncbi:hypothetical protein ACF0H5_021937 [Mactra antiquata]